MERLPVQPRLVREVVHRTGDEVDRHHVDLAALDAEDRHLLGDQAAQPLDGAEEVVRAVDLVDLAGLGMADDDAGPVDPPRHVALAADDALGEVFGEVVRVVLDVLRLVEHVLGEGAVVQACRRDRADLVEAAGLHRLGQPDGVARALDVGHPLAVGVRGEVVDGRQVEEVVDLPVEPLHLLGVDPQPGLGEVADHRDDAALLGAEALGQVVELVE